MLEMILPEYVKQLLENYQVMYSQLTSQLRWLYFDDSFRLVTRVGYLDDGWIRVRLDGHWEFTAEVLREMSWMFYSIGEVGRNVDMLKNALESVGTDRFRVVGEISVSELNITKVGGVAVTGRDWSSDLAKLQNLDIALSSLRDALKPSRSSITQDLSNYSLVGGGSVNIDKSGLDGWSALVVVVRVTYNASATAGIRVRWLYSPDGTNYDSVEEADAQGNYYDPTFAAGATRQTTLLVPILTSYVRIAIYNRDTTYAHTLDFWSLMLR